MKIGKGRAGLVNEAGHDVFRQFLISIFYKEAKLTDQTLYPKI